MKTRNIYEGQQLRYYMDERGSIYEHGTGRPVYYVRNNTLFTFDGGHAHYMIKDRHLYPRHPSLPALVFSYD